MLYYLQVMPSKIQHAYMLMLGAILYRSLTIIFFHPSAGGGGGSPWCSFRSADGDIISRKHIVTRSRRRFERNTRWHPAHTDNQARKLRPPSSKSTGEPFHV